MPEPTLSDIHIDSALTDFSFASFQQQERFIAPSVFPITNVPKRSGKYFTYDTAELRRSDAEKRAPGTESKVRGYKLSSDSYHCEVYSIAVDVSEQERANADEALDPEEDAARIAMQDIQIAMDRIWTNTAFTTGIWATESTGTWNTSTGDIVGDLQTGIMTILEDTGQRPNTLVVGADAWYTGLWGSTQLLNRMPDNAPKIITPNYMQDLFGFSRVFVLDTQEQTIESSTGAPASIHHTDHVLLAYVDPNAGLRGVTAGKTFMWSGLTGGGNGIRTKRLDMPWKDAMPRVEVDTAFDFKVVSTSLGYLIKHVTA